MSCHLGLKLCRVYVHPVQAVLPLCLIHVLFSVCPQVIKSFGILQQQMSQGDQQLCHKRAIATVRSTAAWAIMMVLHGSTKHV